MRKKHFSTKQIGALSVCSRITGENKLYEKISQEAEQTKQG